MPMVRAMRLLNAIEAGTTTGAQLQTLLAADPGRLAELNVLLGLRGQARRMAASSTAMTAVAASSTAMTAVAASSTAMTAVIANSTAMTAVIANSTAMTAVAASSTATDAINASQTASTAVFNGNNAGLFLNQLRIRGGLPTDATLAGLSNITAVAASSTAMTAVIASSTAMTAVAASSTAMTAVAASSTAMAAVWASNTASDAVLTSATAKLAVYNSDMALTALQAAPTQIARQISINGRTTAVNDTSSTATWVANGTKVILLRRWYASQEHDYFQWDRATGNSTLPNGSSVYGSAALGRISGTYTSTGSVPTSSSSDTSNLVAACNGLRRNTWSNGARLDAIYIAV